MKFGIHNLEMYVERPRKYPGGLPVRVSIRCVDCSHRCTVDSYIRNGFQSAFGAKFADVFSMLCTVQAEDIDAPAGQPNLSSDVSE